MFTNLKIKGQLSIEILIIISIFTIGAIIFGTYYLQTVNSNINKSDVPVFDGDRVFSKECTFEQLNSITFNPIGGVYSAPQSVSLTFNGICGQPVNIYYTLDGSEPTLQDNLYSSVLSVSETKTIKAKAFLQSNPAISGGTYTQTYTISFP